MQKRIRPIPTDPPFITELKLRYAKTVGSHLYNGCTKNRPKGRSFLVYPLGFEPKLDGVGGRNVIQLHYEYVFFFKKHIYFTIFRFLFASVYGIILPNSKKNFF